MKPIACIRSGTSTFCGLNSAGSFVFDYMEHALSFYDARSNPKTPIAACPECCDAARKAGDESRRTGRDG